MKNQFRLLTLLLVITAALFINWRNQPEIQNSKSEITPPQYDDEKTVNQLTADELKGGWKLLFNGIDLTGWHNFKEQTIGTGWIVDDKAIHLNAVKSDDGHWQAKDGGDIITADAYENYELRLEWKIGACGNSGIIYNVLEREDLKYVWHSGPELQVLDDSCHPDAKIHKHKAGDLYDLIPCNTITVKTAGQWNKIRLVQRNGKVQHWQNGKKVVEYDQNSPTWKELIAGSKFKSMPFFGSSRKGHIALQDHGDKVWFRNIKIKVFN